MKPLIKELLREELNEISLKNAIATGLMTLGSMGAAKAQTSDTIQKTEPTTQTQAPQKSQFGTPEQRAAAKAKREANRKNNYENFIKGAYIRNFVEKVEDEEFKSNCDLTMNQEADYLDGTSLEIPEVIYRELEDGTKIKINLKKYQKYIKKQGKQDDVGLAGMQGPNFKPTSCGISKASAKQSKKDWKRK